MENGIPNFDQFIGYIIGNPSNTYKVLKKWTKTGFLDPHLEFFWHKCDMCKVHYDVIGKVETSQEDINYVSHKVHNTHQIKLNFIPL